MSKEMTDFPRLIEFAFPLKQASLDSVHEKNVRHGHISTLHIWPARRPLAACRAALIATLLPDPSAQPKPEGMSEAEWQKEIQHRRQELCEKIGGKVVKKIEKKKMPGGRIVEREKEETVGGILHWGRETENAETLEWFRQEIRKAYGRAPRVVDPFAGGGSIPLEAMRLGCEATAIDINPVAWFILKCTLEYPQKLAGKTHPLPEFILHDDSFMAEFFKNAKRYGNSEVTAAIKRLHDGLKKHAKVKANDCQVSLLFPQDAAGPEELEADLAWHVRAWGQWVLDKARRELARFYPVYADFEPLEQGKPYKRRPMRLVPLKEDGTPDIDALNREFNEDYLKLKTNPRWIAKPTVAYLWAHTVTCKNCRATVPLLKTRWLCKKDKKRVLLTMEPNADKSGVVFGIQTDVPVVGGNTAQRREHDKRIGAGTMSRAGAKCPCCGTIQTMEDLRAIGIAGRRGSLMTAVVVDGPDGKEYRLPTEHELACAAITEEQIQEAFKEVPFGVPDEPIVRFGVQGGSYGFPIVVHGFDKWRKLFTSRQLLALGRFVAATRAAREAMRTANYPPEWIEAVGAYLALSVDRMADRCAILCTWDQGYTKVNHVFHRYALPITWDFCEGAPFSETTGNYASCVEWTAKYIDHALVAGFNAPPSSARQQSAIQSDESNAAELIVTDPPYYDAIPYADLMDFFYVWLKRSLKGIACEIDAAYINQLSPKWDHERNDGELIDDCTRHRGDSAASKRVYEEGMARAFIACHRVLVSNGRLVIVFANKKPDAWETLVSAIIRAGFVVDASWPIQTEMSTGLRNYGRASLAASVWLVCKKRPVTAKPGWDNKVLEEMRANISQRLRDFWDAGIRGPDFVWAATGPALEAYSKHPVVKKADSPGEIMTVSEFLAHVRRMVVDFVVGRVLGGDGEAADQAAADRLDEPTAYYLLHRHDFGMEEAPIGACILYATACGLSDQELVRDWDLLVKTGSAEEAAHEDEMDEETDADDEALEDAGSGSKVKLKPWNQRRGRWLGYEAPGGRPVPLVDRIHRLMHLWKGGDVHKVDEYLDEHGLRRHELFRRVLQSLIELSKPGSEERSLLESLSNHVGAKGAPRKEAQQSFAFVREG